MDFSEFATLFPKKMDEITAYVKGDDIRNMFGVEAVSR